MAAEHYGLVKLSENIEDMPDNTTRFLIIGMHPVLPSGDDKTSVMVSVRNRPGALHDLLSPFQRTGIDLTRVETRPSRRGTWSYVFFIDFQGHAHDRVVADVLREIGDNAAELKILGSYPKAVL
jgi:chorismate mutase / prephenate dehydratase